MHGMVLSAFELEVGCVAVGIVDHRVAGDIAETLMSQQLLMII
jgi:hypothetical protein